MDHTKHYILAYTYSYKFQKTKPSSEKKTVHQISMHHHIALVQIFPTFTAPGFYGVYSKLTQQQIDPPKRKNTQKQKIYDPSKVGLVSGSYRLLSWPKIHLERERERVGFWFVYMLSY